MEPEEALEVKDPVDELRERVSNVLKPEHSDEFLLRWLKATKYDVPKAEDMLRQCLRIRYTYQIDHLSEEYVKQEVVLKYAFFSSLGFDLSGAPIRYLAIGKGDYDGFNRCYSTSEMCLFAAYVLENDLKSLRNRNKEMNIKRKEELLVIFDMEEFTLLQLAHKHVIETYLDMMTMFQDLYTPDVVKKIIIINAPTYFYAAFNIFKPILRSDLIEKLEIHSTKETSTEALLQHIDPDVLPEFLGGKKRDENGDPNCASFVKQGGKIPESYYKTCEFLSLEDHPDFKETMIIAGNHEDLVYDITDPGCYMHIEVRSDYCVGTSIFYRKKVDSNDGEVKIVEELISPYTKLQSQICPVVVDIHCERSGEYVFRLDNSFSWLNPKRVQYKFEVIPSKR